MRHAVIMAGGSGTRLWPLSRRKRPKQLLRLFDDKSLLQLSRERLRDLFEPHNIWVITSAAYVDLVARELPDIPRENLIGEPIGRDTANAIGLAAALLHRRDPDGTMAVFTADHLIDPMDVFTAKIDSGLRAAEDHHDALVTFGVTPDSPQTGYGYVRKGPQLAADTYDVLEFKEKPALEVARAYVDSGEYLWNSGMFAWRISAIRDQLALHLPENARVLDEVAQEWGQASDFDKTNHKFAALHRISIDFGVMEKAPRVLVVEIPCRWRDLGSWAAIFEAREADADGNVTIGERALLEDCGDTLIVSDSGHLIAALGVRDLIIVHSEDATLICHRDQAERVRGLAKSCIKSFGQQFE